ncbi:MAG: AraC family transcriptional regulator [Spirochaetota bacterium]
MARRVVLHGMPGEVRVFSSRVEQGTSFWNEHTYYEVAVCIAGSGYYKSRRGRFRFRKTSIVICNQYEPHAWQAVEPVHIRYVQLQRSLVKDILPVLGEGSLLLDAFVRGDSGGFIMHLASPPLFVQIQRIVDTLAEESVRERPYAKAHIRGLVIEILSLIGRDIAGSDRRTTPVSDSIERSLAYIHANIAGDVSLAHAAEAAGLSCDHFSKVFKRGTGFYFTEYMNEMRIREACRLLRSTAKSITDIAFASGYRNVPYFNRIFKATTGFAPAQYRRKAVVLVRAEKHGKSQENNGIG